MPAVKAPPSKARQGMGKAERNRRQNAREKIEAQQAAARRAEARKRMLLASGSVIGVLVIVVAIIVAKNLGSPSAASAGTSASANQASTVTARITTVPASTLNAVGKGTTYPLIPTKGNPPLLTSGGKPEVLYIGAEYCPYCAAERWAMAVALSRFGSVSNLSYIHSSSRDIYPNTPTLTFYKSRYSSKYVDFSPVELYSTKEVGSGYATLQKPTAAQAALMAKYDGPPYIQSTTRPYPFVDIGNRYLVIGAQYLPSDLANLTWAQVAADIRNPSTTVAKGIDGAANAITAAICNVTKNAPAAVCDSAGAKAGAGAL